MNALARAVLVSALALLSASASSLSFAQTIPEHAEGLREAIVSIDLAEGRTQAGLLSLRSGVEQPTVLAVLLPGYPSVVRPEVEEGVMVRSRLTGNFLIRARRFLADEQIATLVVDCPSDSGSECSSRYQASRQREEDVSRLITTVKARYPSLEAVWLIGTSMGTISSAFMPTYRPQAYAGAIHTAGITDPYARGSYSELARFDYAKVGVPQFFVHHVNDPCALTPYWAARQLSDRYSVPLVSVSGGSEFRGRPCDAFTEHGFRGMEKAVMQSVAGIVRTGRPASLEIKAEGAPAR